MPDRTSQSWKPVPYPTMTPTVVITSACDFPNGLAAANRIRMLARTFSLIGLTPYCVFQYAPGIMPDGINTHTSGEIDGVKYIYPLGSLRAPRDAARMFWCKTWGLWRTRRYIVKLASMTKLQYVLSYGNTGFEDMAYLNTARRIGAQYLLEVCDSHNIVFNAHSRGLQHLKESLKFRANQYKDTRVIPRVDGLFVISNYLKQHYAGLLPPERILLVPILGDKDEFHAESYRNQPLNHRLLWLGNFRPFEGLEFLIDVLTELSRLTIDYHCDIFAVTPKHAAYAQTIQGLIDSRRLSHRIRLNNAVPRDKLFEALHSADIVMVPRQDSELNRSNFPTKMVDYLFAGKPIVSSRVGEIPLYCQDGVHIIYPTDTDPKSFATAVYSLMQHPDRASVVGRGARLLAESEFEFRKIAPRIAAFLANISQRTC